MKKVESYKDDIQYILNDDRQPIFFIIFIVFVLIGCIGIIILDAAKIVGITISMMSFITLVVSAICIGVFQTKNASIKATYEKLTRKKKVSK